MIARCLFLMTLLVAAAANAHHSRAAFDLNSSIEVEGTLGEMSWRNPHAFLVVDSFDENGNAVRWTFEGHSIAGLTRLGWSPETFNVGERVVVAARPNRNADRRFGLLNHVTRADGTTFYAFSRPEGSAPPPRRPVAPSTNFSGIWRPIVDAQQALVGGFEPPADWPYTEKGWVEVDRFNLNDDPGLDCVPYPMPRLTRWPYNQRWTVSGDNITIIHEQASSERNVSLLPGASVPPSHVPDQMGYSVGQIDADGTLVVTTRGFAATTWGSERGVSSSEQKRVVERYRLTDGGYGLELVYEITDPEYLSETVELGRNFLLVSDYPFTEVECDAVTARRHLQFDQ